MKIGVSITPRAVASRPRRARESGSVVSNSNIPAIQPGTGKKGEDNWGGRLAHPAGKRLRKTFRLGGQIQPLTNEAKICRFSVPWVPE
jgi:hypothetical protein